MAINGNEDDEVMIEVTNIKTGNKREFERMMKQIEYYCISLPPRRALRSQLTPKKSPFQRLSGKKREIEVHNNNNVVEYKWNISEKPLILYTRRSKADIAADIAFVPKRIEDEDVDVDVDVVNLSSSNSKPELSKNVELKKIPTKLKELLQTNLLDGLHVRYVKGFKTKVQGEADLHGKINGTSILCFCNDCNGKKVVTPNQFELHAGSRNKRPSEYIRLDNGKSFRDVLNLCQIVPLDSLEQQIKFAIGLADAQEGLIPQSAEQTSGDSEPVILNSDILHTCNTDVLSVHDKSTDKSNDVCSTIQCNGQILKFSNTNCFFCRRCHFTTEFGPYTTIYCDQCEKEYHIKCLKENGMDDLKSVPSEEWCCSKECGAVYSTLNQLLNAGEQTLPPQMLTIINEKRQASVGARTSSELSLKWRLLNGKMASDKQHKKLLTSALNVFNMRFTPTRLYSTISKGKYLNLVPTMVNGKSMDEYFFGGMYCAVLIQKSTVVCTAVFRIFGQELAEIPLAATKSELGKKGFCQALIGCIENLMASMNVKEVLLPASHEAEGFWRSKFGFEVLSDEQLIKYKRDYALVTFENATMLHKSLLPKPEMMGEAN